jgi:CheY-like chemotaxis protein
VLTVDDSSVARKQVTRCLQTVGVEVVALNDGRQALDYLRKLVEEGKKPEEEFLMMISDIEMPEMDGYTLTAKSAATHACKNCISSCILRCRGIQPGDGQEGRCR